MAGIPFWCYQSYACYVTPPPVPLPSSSVLIGHLGTEKMPTIGRYFREKKTKNRSRFASSQSDFYSFILIAPSMVASTMGRYFSGHSCNLWLTRWRWALSSPIRSGLK